MSTAAQVQAAWVSAIWQHATITAITDKIYGYEVTTASEKEVNNISFDQGINFIEHVTTRTPGQRELGGQGSALCTFLVEVRYTKEKYKPGDAFDGDAFTDVRNFFDTLVGLIESELGSNWDSSVDYFDYPDAGLELIEQEVAGRACWRGIQRFQGVQYTTL